MHKSSRRQPLPVLTPPPSSMFNQQELQILIGGVNTPVDVEDLRSNTNYGGLYNDDNETIQAFWRVSSDFVSSTVSQLNMIDMNE